MKSRNLAKEFSHVWAIINVVNKHGWSKDTQQSLDAAFENVAHLSRTKEYIAASEAATRLSLL